MSYPGKSSKINRDSSRREFVRNTFAAILATGFLSRLQAAEKDASDRPNVVVILADDQGWGDLDLTGNHNLKTPNIDSISREGATFDRFFVCPVCAPTRAEFLTGRYHLRGGVHGVTRGAERLNLDEKTIGDTFKAAGYATAAFGKWHNGTQYPYHPNGRGFDEFYGFCSGHWGLYFNPVLEHNGKIVRGKGFIIDDLTNHAIKFIEQNKKKSFFCYLPYNIPHSPFQVPERFYKRFANDPIGMRNRDPEKEQIGKTRCVLAMCENIDWNVGRVLARLKELNLYDNTIVVYFSDNGPNTWRWNGGMKGKKGSTDEGGVRVPCVIRWPGHIKPGTKIPQIAGAIDLLPTLSDMAGIEIVGSKVLDGLSVKPLLFGSAKSWSDRMIFTHQNGRVSVRTQRYRLDNRGKLFDMINDPGQYKDISRKKPEVARKLSRALKKWKAEVLPGSRKDDRPFTVGYPEFPTTILPARDGVPFGNVQRSARAPNCSFFKDWKDKSDRMSWDIEVAKSGRYEAVIYYTCTKKNVGSKVELSFKESSVQARITRPNDPPLVGAELDRFHRGSESYVKDFKPFRLGVFNLEKGRGDLILRALEIPGDGVIDVRSIILTLL